MGLFDFVQRKIEYKFIVVLVLVSVAFFAAGWGHIYQSTITQLITSTERTLNSHNSRIAATLQQATQRKEQLGRFLNRQLLQYIEQKHVGADNATTGMDETLTLHSPRLADNTIRIIDPKSSLGIFVPATTPLDETELNSLRAARVLHREVLPIVKLSFLNIHYTSAHGSFVLTPHGNLVDDVASSYDAKTYPFYYYADAEHNPTRSIVWTPLYYDQHIMSSLVMPLYRNDSLIGVTGNDYDLEQMFSDFLRIAKSTQNITSFLFDLNGHIIVHPDHMSEIRSCWRRKHNLFKPDGWLAKFLQLYYQQIVAGNDAMRVKDGDTEYIVVARPVGFLDWQIASYQRYDSVVGEVDQLLSHSVIVIAIFTVLIVLLIVVLVRRLIVVRIMTLKGYVENFSVGTELQQPDIVAGNDEIYQLAETFYHMGMLTQKKVAELYASKEDFRTTLNSIGDAVIATDTNGNVTAINPAAERLTGWNAEDCVGQPLDVVFNIINVSTRIAAENPVQQVLKEGKTVELANHTVLLAKDGCEYHIADSAAPIYVADGTITGVVLVFSDISAQYNVREQLKNSEERYRTFFVNSTDPMMILQDGMLVDCNQALVTLLQYDSTDELIHCTTVQISPEFQPDGQRSDFKYHEMINMVLQNGAYRFEWNHLTKGGDIVPVEISATKIPSENGMVVHGVMRDISKQNQALQQLKHLAHHNPLTGLPNRLLLSARLEHSIQHIQRENALGAVLFMDLDNFKKINDSLGHSAGDEVLITVAQRLLEHSRDVDTVAHLGGDEFVIILHSISSIGDAELHAKQIMTSMQQPFIIDGYEMFISCSIGIVEFDSSCSDMESLLKKADAAMYKAKDEGKNGYQLYSANMTDIVMEKVLLESQLRRALERNEIVVHYQPQVALPSGKIIAVEALMRWQHPELGLVPPDRFIPLSEETGLIIPMGEWIMRESCRQFVAWRQQGYDIHRVAVNLSGKQIHLDTLPDTVLNILQETGCPAYALELEITEGFVMRHPEASIAMLNKIRQLGVSLSVDDFGTGHSSLKYLKRLPINRLKIDRSFVMDIGNNPDGEVLVETIVTMGHSLKLSITAEGIETEQQKRFLDLLGCNEGQGYLFSKPLPVDQLTAKLSKR